MAREYDEMMDAVRRRNDDAISKATRYPNYADVFECPTCHLPQGEDDTCHKCGYCATCNNTARGCVCVCPIHNDARTICFFEVGTPECRHPAWEGI